MVTVPLRLANCASATEADRELSAVQAVAIACDTVRRHTDRYRHQMGDSVGAGAYNGQWGMPTAISLELLRQVPPVWPTQCTNRLIDFEITKHKAR